MTSEWDEKTDERDMGPEMEEVRDELVRVALEELSLRRKLNHQPGCLCTCSRTIDGLRPGSCKKWRGILCDAGFYEKAQ